MTSIEKLLFYVSLGILSFMIGFSIGELAKADQLENRYKVAIIDTGFTPLPFDSTGLKLCETGHYDFNSKTPTIGLDTIGHGAYVAGLVNAYADTNNICFLIYKVFGKNIEDGQTVVDSALIKAYRAGAKAVNMSLSMSEYSKKTKKIITYLTKRGIKIYVSAGNSQTNMNQKCASYPVCYKNIGSNMIVVGALDRYGSVANYSNYGTRVDVYQMGDLGMGRGTSFASPRALGEYIKSLGLDND